MKISLLHAELTDQSYNLYKLEAYARVHSAIVNEELLINYSIGKNNISIPYSKVTAIDNYEVVKFMTFLEKQSGLSSEGISFRLSSSSSMTDIYYIGGRHGEIIMEETKIKHHQLYLHHDNLTGAIIIKSSSRNKKVRFVCFNGSHYISTEAIFREGIAYSENEVWEYSVVLSEESLNQDWSFYVELLESNASSRDDNFTRYYKLWEQIPRSM
ncbi:hypothetical protein LG307_13935 [Sutcliffiella horikoshii]|uniref:hypothetical protein n=1 Tax=Sutcliffiella horikoshii TaxID=79883 RepID=UPI003850BEB8